MKRASGILLHITSLPSPFGIGDLGPAAYRFADFLAEARQTYWQILPLTATSEVYGHSPYASPSAFAGNPLLVSPEALLADDLIKREDIEEHPPFPSGRVDYKSVAPYKLRILDKAFERYQARGSNDIIFEKFCHEQSDWLDDYSLFVALKAEFLDVAWLDWPPAVRDREKGALREAKKRCRDRMKKEQFFQYLFYKQWTALKHYSNKKNIFFIGDMPIYVGGDSVDVWANPQYFKLDKEKRPTAVAGVPPDYFSETGQLWGNPVYRWDILKETRYGWWVKRLRHNLACFDGIRLDHFRGFVQYWEVPASERTAKKGKWVKAASDEFFAALVLQFPDVPIFAEDLGLITPDVHALRDRHHIPGMAVLQFGFGDQGAHMYLPHRMTEDRVIYTGTHDNDTTLGWWQSTATGHEKWAAETYVGKCEDGINWGLIRAAQTSPASFSVIPIQDVLGLGSEARLNTPSTHEGNYHWRFRPGALTRDLSEKLAHLAEVTDRMPQAVPVPAAEEFAA